MGKSIFTTIETEADKFEVTHAGNTMNFVLPDWFQELKGKMEDSEAIWAWAKENEIELAFCHRAIGQMIIDFRAAARPSDIKGEVQQMVWDSAQQRIDNLVFKPTKRPGTGGSKRAIKDQAELETIKGTCLAMLGAGLEDEMIKTTLAAQFDKKKVSIALNNAHSELND